MASLLTLTYSQPTRKLETGDVLITEGDPGGTLYVLEDGRLTIERDGVGIAEISEPGALVGEMSSLLGSKYSATVRAVKPSSVRVVRDAIRYFERQPLVALHVAMVLSQRLDATSAMLVQLQKELGRTGESATDKGMITKMFGAIFGAHAP